MFLFDGPSGGALLKGIPSETPFSLFLNLTAAAIYGSNATFGLQLSEAGRSCQFSISSMMWSEVSSVSFLVPDEAGIMSNVRTFFVSCNLAVSGAYIRAVNVANVAMAARSTLFTIQPGPPRLSGGPVGTAILCDNFFPVPMVFTLQLPPSPAMTVTFELALVVSGSLLLDPPSWETFCKFSSFVGGIATRSAALFISSIGVRDGKSSGSFFVVCSQAAAGLEVQILASAERGGAFKAASGSFIVLSELPALIGGPGSSGVLLRNVVYAFPFTLRFSVVALLAFPLSLT